MINTEFDNKMLLLIEMIGFNLVIDDTNSTKYTYYPEYLGDKHYTLLIFQGGPVVDINRKRLHEHDLSKDYRLYIHNKDGSYSSSPFQIGSNAGRNDDAIEKELRKEFRNEFRNNLLESILT